MSLSKTQLVAMTDNAGKALADASLPVTDHPAAPATVAAAEALMEKRVDEVSTGIGTLHTLIGSDTVPTSLKGQLKAKSDEAARLTTEIGSNTVPASLKGQLKAKTDEIGSDTDPLSLKGQLKTAVELANERQRKLSDANSSLGSTRRRGGIGWGLTALLAILFLALWMGGCGSQTSSDALVRMTEDRDNMRTQRNAFEGERNTARAERDTAKIEAEAAKKEVERLKGGTTGSSSGILPKNVATKAHVAKVVAQQAVTDARQDGQIMNLQQQVGRLDGRMQTLEEAMREVRRTETNIAGLEKRIETLEGAARSSAQKLVIEMRSSVQHYHTAIQRVYPAYQPSCWYQYCP